jgi:hypothetical protein
VGSFSVKLVEQILPLMTLHGQVSRTQRVLLPRWRRSGAEMQSRGVEVAFQEKYGWRHTIHIGDHVKATLGLSYIVLSQTLSYAMPLVS